MYEFCRIGRNLSLLSSCIAKHSCPSISHNTSSHTYIYNTHYGAKKCLISLQENLKALLFIPLTFQPILSFQTKILCHVASNSFLFLVMFSATSMMVSHRRRKKTTAKSFHSFVFLPSTCSTHALYTVLDSFVSFLLLTSSCLLTFRILSPFDTLGYYWCIISLAKTTNIMQKL